MRACVFVYVSVCVHACVGLYLPTCTCVYGDGISIYLLPSYIAHVLTFVCLLGLLAVTSSVTLARLLSHRSSLSATTAAAVSQQPRRPEQQKCYTRHHSYHHHNYYHWKVSNSNVSSSRSCSPANDACSATSIRGYKRRSALSSLSAICYSTCAYIYTRTFPSDTRLRQMLRCRDPFTDSLAFLCVSGNHSSTFDPRGRNRRGTRTRPMKSSGLTVSWSHTSSNR